MVGGGSQRIVTLFLGGVDGGGVGVSLIRWSFRVTQVMSLGVLVVGGVLDLGSVVRVGEGV